VELSNFAYLDHDQGITVIDDVACGDHDFRNGSGNVGEHRYLHLHRLQDHHWVVGRHLLSNLDFDLHNGRDEFSDDGMAHAAIVGFLGDAFR
jgi:hypothetical protein